MHDVTKTLHLHKFGHIDCSRLAHLGEIVSSEVHQHQVLCLLFGICHKSVGEGLILFDARTARPRSIDGKGA